MCILESLLLAPFLKCVCSFVWIFVVSFVCLNICHCIVCLKIYRFMCLCGFLSLPFIVVRFVGSYFCLNICHRICLFWIVAFLLLFLFAWIFFFAFVCLDICRYFVTSLVCRLFVITYVCIQICFISFVCVDSSFGMFCPTFFHVCFICCRLILILFSVITFACVQICRFIFC